MNRRISTARATFAPLGVAVSSTEVNSEAGSALVSGTGASGRMVAATREAGPHDRGEVFVESPVMIPVGEDGRWNLSVTDLHAGVNWIRFAHADGSPEESVSIGVALVPSPIPDRGLIDGPGASRTPVARAGSAVIQCRPGRLMEALSA